MNTSRKRPRMLPAVVAAALALLALICGYTGGSGATTAQAMMTGLRIGANLMSPVRHLRALQGGECTACRERRTWDALRLKAHSLAEGDNVASIFDAPECRALERSLYQLRTGSLEVTLRPLHPDGPIFDRLFDLGHPNATSCLELLAQMGASGAIAFPETVVLRLDDRFLSSIEKATLDKLDALQDFVRASREAPQRPVQMVRFAFRLTEVPMVHVSTALMRHAVGYVEMRLVEKVEFDLGLHVYCAEAARVLLRMLQLDDVTIFTRHDRALELRPILSLTRLGVKWRYLSGSAPKPRPTSNPLEWQLVTGLQKMLKMRQANLRELSVDVPAELLSENDRERLMWIVEHGMWLRRLHLNGLTADMIPQVAAALGRRQEILSKNFRRVRKLRAPECSTWVLENWEGFMGAFLELEAPLASTFTDEDVGLDLGLGFEAPPLGVEQTAELDRAHANLERLFTVIAKMSREDNMVSAFRIYPPRERRPLPMYTRILEALETHLLAPDVQIRWLTLDLAPLRWSSSTKASPLKLRPPPIALVERALERILARISCNSGVQGSSSEDTEDFMSATSSNPPLVALSRTPSLASTDSSAVGAGTIAVRGPETPAAGCLLVTRVDLVGIRLRADDRAVGDLVTRFVRNMPSESPLRAVSLAIRSSDKDRMVRDELLPDEVRLVDDLRRLAFDRAQQNPHLFYNFLF